MTDLEAMFRRLEGRVAASGRRPTTYAYGDDPSQVAELWLPDGEGPFPVAAVLHGGFWQAAYGYDHIRAVCAELAGMGVAAWNIEYRRVGNGGGVPATFDDVGAAFDLLGSVDAPVDLDRVVALGHSAGGHLATWCGGGGWVSGVVSLGGVLDTRTAAAEGIGEGAIDDFCGGSSQERPVEHDAIDVIGRLPLGVEVAVIHGADDDWVPVAQAWAFERACQDTATACEVTVLEGVGHYELIDPDDQAFETVRAEVLRLTGTGTGTGD